MTPVLEALKSHLQGNAYARLGEVKRTYDPNDVFQSNHPIAPAAG